MFPIRFGCTYLMIIIIQYKAIHCYCSIEVHCRIWDLSSYVYGVLKLLLKTFFIANFVWPLHQTTAIHVWLNWQQYRLSLILFLFNILIQKWRTYLVIENQNFAKENNSLESNYKLLIQMKTTKERHALKYSCTELDRIEAPWAD